MSSSVGLSGVSLYVPPHRVSLEDWCEWTDSNWSKVSAVVGRSFRVKGPDESVYTMAASAVLRLIENYDVDPSTIGMLVLGTESSTDNAAGAVI
ncbi:MAG: hydroxymethylglutaryl-CoA synthase, partial [Myxococcota bacterium]